MTWVDLGNPYLLAEPRSYQPLRWPTGKRIELVDQVPSEARGFAQIALERRTRYGFGPVSLDSLGSLFLLTNRVQSLGTQQLGFALSKRPAPSAGAIHPIHIVVHVGRNGGWYRYDPVDHVLIELSSSIQPQTVRAAMNQIVEGGDAALVLFVAEPGKTFAKYGDACSLVWRDAGVLLGYFSLAAEALDLSFCPLGVTGEPWGGRLINEAGLIGVGAAFVG